MTFILLAASLLEFSRGPVDFKIEGETGEVDTGKSLFLESTLTAPEGVDVPDLRERARGFQLVEQVNEEPYREDGGRMIQKTQWRLMPKPCEKVYKIAPFQIGDEVAGPVYFTQKPQPELSGDMEIEAKKVMPPLSFRLVGKIFIYILGALALAGSVFFIVKYLRRRIREFRMSPIERAFAELEALLKKGLPGRGRYKDFYVELTRLVRRYVQRKYGVKAPHLTTEEFLRDFKSGSPESLKALKEFMEEADMVKFAGVKATPEMTDCATDSARSYLKGDNAAQDMEANK
ncbi:MAG: hypothetical protein IJQ34_08880 [Kiritimatiellae bacterium]|nr:hypothetical protein [Kiritimatiellia bacterium]